MALATRAYGKTRQRASHGSYLTGCPIPTGARLNRMELTGALWNLYNQGRLPRLAALRKRLLARIPPTEVVERPLRLRQGALLEAVAAVLERAGCPLRVREVQAAVEQLFGEPVPLSSVSEALSTHAIGGGQRFRRVRYGTYEVASTASSGRMLASSSSL